MNDFRTASDFSSTSLSNLGQSRDLNSGVASWSSQGMLLLFLITNPFMGGLGLSDNVDIYLMICKDIIYTCAIKGTNVFKSLQGNRTH